MARLSPANVTRVAVQRFGRAPLSSASPATVSCVLKTRGLSSSTTIARQAQASKPQSAVAAKELGPFGLKNDYARIQKSRNAKKPWKTELNPSWLLERASRIYPNNTAVLHEGRSYNYREMNERVLKFASALKAIGLKKGDRVIFICPNSPAILEGHFAVPLAGGVIVTVNTRLKPEEIGYIVQHSGARFAIVDRELGHLKEAMLGEWGVEKVIVDQDTGKVGCEFQDMLDKAEPKTWYNFDMVEDEDELMSICYTSGTTGNPKGVMHSYRQSYMEAIAQTLEMGFNTSTRYLWILPMFHAAGWCIPWAVTMMGGAHQCLRKIDYDNIWTLFNEGVTHYNGAPTVQTFITNHHSAHRLSNTVKAMVAGSPPSPALIEKMISLNIEVIHVYGMTETLGPCARCYPQDSWASYLQNDDYESYSRVLAMQGQNYVLQDELRVVDENMNDVPADGETMGEVVMRGNITMLGYYKDQATTDKTFKGGWLHSGDLAVRMPDGYVALKDRAKDIIISGGENISTVEVENMIQSHPKVLEVAVVPTPDHTWGERPKAFVVLKKEVTEHGQFGPGEIEEEIIKYCRLHLAGFKIPARIQLEHELPKTATGKIRKNVLRDQEWAAVGGRKIN